MGCNSHYIRAIDVEDNTEYPVPVFLPLPSYGEVKTLGQFAVVVGGLKVVTHTPGFP